MHWQRAGWKATTPQTLEGALKQTDQARVIMELSSPHRITHVSNAWEELCGYELSEVAGQPAFSILGVRSCPRSCPESCPKSCA